MSNSTCFNFRFFPVIAICGFFALTIGAPVPGNAGNNNCDYMLNQGGGELGTAEINIHKSNLLIKIRDAQPDTLYTVWVDFRQRDFGNQLPANFPANARVVTPAFATDEGVTSGIGMDINGIVTDHDGDATVHIGLDYEILDSDVTPIVGGLAMQGLNVVGGYWMRLYPEGENVMPSLQIPTSDPEVAEIERSTAAGFTIVRHPDFITHGLAPGVKNVDHFSAWNGDIPSSCRS